MNLAEENVKKLKNFQEKSFIITSLRLDLKTEFFSRKEFLFGQLMLYSVSENVL